ncbi:unnamed protein product [Closterium sp. NIES-54]
MANGGPFADGSTRNDEPRRGASQFLALLVGASICAAFTELQEVLPAAWLQLLMLRFFSAARVGDRQWRNLITLTVLVVATQACGTTVAYASMYAMDLTANILASSQIAVANVLPCLADSLFRFTYRFFQQPLEATIVPSVPVSCILSQAPTNNIPPRPPPSLCQHTAANASTHFPTLSMRLGADGGEGGNGGGQGECRHGVSEGEVSAAVAEKEETGRAKAAAGEAAESTTAAAAAREAWEKWEAWRVAGIARMVQQTQQRARAGDVLILWSEAPVIILDDHGEAKLLADLAAIATAASTSRAAAAATSTAAAAATAVGDDATPSTLGPYLGASFVKLIAPNLVTNTFALIDPSGAPILRYNKTHLFPSVEANVQPGPGSLPVVDTPLGRLSVAVCFDMQFPALIRQAGRQGVDILLQPSWTWGTIGHVTLQTDAVRAAENGLTLLRCSSIGVSGVVSPYYRTLNAQCVLLLLWA